MKECFKKVFIVACILTLAIATESLAKHKGFEEQHGMAHGLHKHVQAACDELNGQVIGGATITATSLVAATATTPEYCKVTGLISPKLNFEIRLPSHWNRKLHYSGGGGYNGSVPAANISALLKGYVDVSSDSGHQSFALDASWALNDIQAASLFGHLSIPTVMASALEIVRTCYGRLPVRSYFEGCSNGGREGLMMAQRYPLLFDGIIAGDPINNWVGAFGAFKRTAKALSQPGGEFTIGKIATLAGAVLDACDDLDGLKDGIVSNPDACEFDPDTLRCPDGDDKDDSCLSDAQLAVVTSLTSDSSFDGGLYENVGWPLTGNEDESGSWDSYVTGPENEETGLCDFHSTATYIVQDTTVKYFFARDPDADSLAYDWDSNPAALYGTAALIDATNADLRPFQGGGGKLIMWNGWNSQAVSAKNTIYYYEQVIDAVGGQIEADEFVRLYIAPGVNHCSGGPGCAPVDMLSALDDWVTRGVAPEVLSAANVDSNGNTLKTRPLCVYPQYPHYNGEGDVNAADSFTCINP